MRTIPCDLQRYCDETQRKLEDKYLQFSEAEPWRQSGMSGPMDRWTSLRKPIADCVDRDGSLLDLCCANGFLLECVSQWTQERGITIRPYGLDISPKLIDLARTRLPQHRSRLFAGNSFVWLPPEKMDFVSTMSGLYPRQYEDDYVKFVVQNHLKDDGRLLVHCTGPRDGAEQSMRESFSLDLFNQVGHKIGYDPVHSKEVYVAIIMKGSPNNSMQATPNGAPDG